MHWMIAPVAALVPVSTIGALALTPAALRTPAAAPADTVLVPAVFRENRIYVRPVTAKGDTLVFYTDTGGGVNMIFEPAAERLGLPRRRVAGPQDSVTIVDWPAMADGAAIPLPAIEGPFGPGLWLRPFDGEIASLLDDSDAGFLGRHWFADRVWTFDYPAGRLVLRPAGNLPPHRPGQRVELGFGTDSSGARTTHFPRIRALVEGDSLDFLFDTGATMVLTDSALARIGDGRPARRAASFISATVFDRWRQVHPGWRVIERATAFGADLIEVPAVEIAGRRVGPVWFEKRRAGVFEEWMSRMMDRPIVGALGGNALGFFRVTVDYPNAVAVFEGP